MNFPTELSPAGFDKNFRSQPHLWRDGVEQICRKHGVAFSDFQTFNSESSNLIARVADEFIVKVFPPFHRNQWESERRALEKLNSEVISIPVPRLIAEGERPEKWTYIIMSRLPGVSLDQVWPKLSITEKSIIMREVGQVMAQVHSLTVGQLQNLEPKWDVFLTKQFEQCVSRHTKLKMPDWFLNELPSYLDQCEKQDFLSQASVILTGEYTPFNLLVTEEKGKWGLSGLIDFGDTMIGFSEYDFVGPCLFSCEGNPLFIESLFEGYGYSSSSRSPCFPCTDAQLRRRLMLLAILHRYSNLKNKVRIQGVWERVKSIEELEIEIFCGRK